MLFFIYFVYYCTQLLISPLITHKTYLTYFNLLLFCVKKDPFCWNNQVDPVLSYLADICEFLIRNSAEVRNKITYT
jgi:hypothetical protein